MEIDDSPIDWTTPYDERDEDWYDKRNTILATNLEIEDDATAAIVMALKDCAEELKHTLGIKLTESEKEVARLKELGNEEVARQKREIESKEEIKRLEMELEMQKKLVDMRKEVETWREKAMSNEAKIAWATAAATSNRDKPQGFSLKAGSLTPYHGEKVADKAYTWIEAAERVLLTRAYETNTSDSTNRWALYVIPYLKGSAFEWAQLRWPLQKTLGGTAVSYAVDWEEFKKEFLLQHVPADAIAVLRKRIEKLEVTGSIRNFNEQFRLLRMRLRIAVNEPLPITITDNSVGAEERNRLNRTIAESHHVTTYGLKLQKAGEKEYKKGNHNGPMSRVYLEWTKMTIEHSNRTPPHIPTLDAVMNYMETMDNAINHRNMTSTSATVAPALQIPPSQHIPVTQGDAMDWEASKMDVKTSQLFELLEKALKGAKDGRPTCSVCKKQGHSQKDCWKVVGLPEWVKERARQRDKEKRKSGQAHLKVAETSSANEETKN